MSLVEKNIEITSASCDICGYQNGIKAWFHHRRHWAFQQIKHSWQCDSVFHWWICFHLHIFPPSNLNSGIKSRGGVCPLSKYNQPMNSVTCPCQACLKSRKLNVVLRRVKGMWREQSGKKNKKNGGKRYANIRMTSLLREENEGWQWERQERSHVSSRSERKYITGLWQGN